MSIARVTGHVHTFPGGGVGYRTRLMTRQQAIAFARCLAHNPRYRQAEAVLQSTARGPRNWYVRYIPSAERCDAIVSHLGAERAERARVEGPNYTFWPDPDNAPLEFVLSSSGEVYELGIRAGVAVNCSCPDYHYRGRLNSIPCKHMRARGFAPAGEEGR